MQNLQIRYEESSAHLEYLQQFSLIQEEEVQRHTIGDFEEYYEQFQFKETVAEDSSSQNQMPFEEFVEKALNLHQTNFLKRYSKIIKGFSLVLFGDVFEYAYSLDNHTLIKPVQLLITYKWVIIFQILFLFLIFALASFHCITILFFALVYFVQKQTIYQSQVQKSANFKPKFQNLMNKLKLIHLHQRALVKISLNNLKNNMKQYAKSLQDLYGLSLNETPFIIDKISELMYNIYEQIKKKNYSYLFLSCKSFVQRKYYFWRLKIQNKRLLHIQKVFQAILEQFDNTKAQKQVRYTKPLPNKSIYFLVLMSKFQQLANHQSEIFHLPLQNKSLLRIIKNQIQFKHAFNNKKKKLISQITQQKDEPEIGGSEIPHFSSSTKVQSDSYYYEDDETIAKYEPQSLQIIKEKLNELFKAKETLQRLQKKVQTTEQLHKFCQQKGKKQLFSFGIPFLPPKRDMQAYYIE